MNQNISNIQLLCQQAVMCDIHTQKEKSQKKLNQLYSQSFFDTFLLTILYYREINR